MIKFQSFNRQTKFGPVTILLNGSCTSYVTFEKWIIRGIPYRGSFHLEGSKIRSCHAYIKRLDQSYPKDEPSHSARKTICEAIETAVSEFYQSTEGIAADRQAGFIEKYNNYVKLVEDKNKKFLEAAELEDKINNIWAVLKNHPDIILANGAM
jgi:hypothetical protein